MKKYRFFTFALLLLATSCHFLNAKLITKNEKIENADFKNNDGFIVAMMIIGNFEDVIQQQKEQKPALKFKSKGAINRGDSADIVFDISGCLPNKNGFCDIAADITAFDPKNHVYFDVKDFPLSVGYIQPKPFLFFVPETSLKFTAEKEDHLGQYLIKATVKDKVSGKENNLTITFKVIH